MARFYDFYYLLIVMDRKTHSLAALPRLFSDPSQLVNKNRTHSPTVM